MKDDLIDRGMKKEKAANFISEIDRLLSKIRSIGGEVELEINNKTLKIVINKQIHVNIIFSNLYTVLIKWY